MSSQGKHEEVMKALEEAQAAELEGLKQHMVKTTMNSTVIAMALLQGLAGIKGSEDLIAQAEPRMVNEVRGMLYRQGYIIRRVTGELQISSLGEETLNKAMNGQLKAMKARRSNK